jgi:branched-chain amino acid transport system substrate-binding protein
MQILLNAICRAGLNRGRIRDALAGTESYKGVTGDMVFDPNSKNISPLFLARVHEGKIDYRRITMEKPYAQVGENGVQYAGPKLPDQIAGDLKIGVFGPHADELVRSTEILQMLSTLSSTGKHLSLIAIPSESSWGKASSDLVKAVYQEHVVALIALDRPFSHLAEQIAVKSFVPVVAISSDRALTSTNIPWIFRVPEGTPLGQALRSLSAAIEQVGPNRASVRKILASGRPLAGVSFSATGEPTR